MKLSINLLPIEFTEQDLKRAKFYKIQIIGVSIVLFMFFLASLTVSLRILQSKKITQIQNQLTQSEEKVSGLKNTQASLFILKSRVAEIDKYFQISSNQTQIYKIITKLVPSSVSVNSISVDKAGVVLVVATTNDPVGIDNFINNLNSKETNEGRISQISLESRNRGKDGVFRINLNIKSKFI